MSVSPDGDRIVIVTFISSNNTFACSTTFVSACSSEDIKEGIRVKLEFSAFTTFTSMPASFWRLYC